MSPIAVLIYWLLTHPWQGVDPFVLSQNGLHSGRMGGVGSTRGRLVNPHAPSRR